MASDASTMATNPRVSIKPSASSIATSADGAAVGVWEKENRSGRRRAAREDHRFELVRRRGDDMPVPQVADRGRGGGPRGHGSLDLGQLAADEDRDQRASRDLVTGDGDPGGLGHGVRGLDGGGESVCLDQSQRASRRAGVHAPPHASGAADALEWRVRPPGSYPRPRRQKTLTASARMAREGGGGMRPVIAEITRWNHGPRCADARVERGGYGAAGTRALQNAPHTSRVHVRKTPSLAIGGSAHRPPSTGRTGSTTCLELSPSRSA